MINIKRLKTFIGTNLINMSGWRTSRKLVVFESDDWGSIRMPSLEIYNKCLDAGYRVDLNPFERYDSLASEEDLLSLFEVLSSFKDINGNNPVITANCVVANPDFEKIKKDNFTKYYFELITATFNKYPKHKNCFLLWEKGIDQGIFYPQYHGREHLNVSMFMNALQQGNRDAHFGFLNRMPGSIKHGQYKSGNYYVEATMFKSESERRKVLEIIIDGIEIFYQLFHYEAESFVPTNYVWSPKFNKELSNKGIKYNQGSRRMIEPIPGNISKKYNRILGKTNYGQINLVRNCRFEPSLVTKSNEVTNCLKDIEIAFKWHKPAIISSHRINFCGFIDESNRDNNLELFAKLLKRILYKWPDTEFITSNSMGKIIENSYNSLV